MNELLIFYLLFGVGYGLGRSYGRFWYLKALFQILLWPVALGHDIGQYFAGRDE